ncbi:MAG: hypothetical protein LIP08_05220 [Bacteroides sp.]|nr:hypothetical protein [Bacteroides sp.]
MLDLAQQFLDSAAIYGPMVDSIRENFIPECKRWSMKHTFRANNAGGNKTIGHYEYYFNKDITKIVDREDISK